MLIKVVPSQTQGSERRDRKRASWDIYFISVSSTTPWYKWFSSWLYQRSKQKYFWWFCRLCHQMLDYLNKIMQTFIINIKSEKIDHLTVNIFYIKTWKTESEWVGRKNFWKTLSEGERLDIWSSLIFFQFSLPVNFSLHITISSTLVTLLNCLARGWIWENISEPQLENIWTDWK